MVNEKYWEAFHDSELKNYDTLTHSYKKKGYLHLDRRIWYPGYATKFRDIVCDPNNIARLAFKPLVSISVETRRFRFDSSSGTRKIQLKPRPIAYAAHFDALVYGFYNTILSRLYENYIITNSLGKCVLAYRRLGFNNIHFAKDAYEHIASRGVCSAIAIDVKGFFDHLDHKILKEAWLIVLKDDPLFQENQLPGDHYNLYRSLTKYACISKKCLLCQIGIKDRELSKMDRLCDDATFKKLRWLVQVNHKGYGIPQGTPISAVLSNVYMISFDEVMHKLASDRKWYYRRYCDDILLICGPDETDEVQKIVADLLDNLKLTINKDKTDIIDFRTDGKGKLRGYKLGGAKKFKSLQYLGFEFNGQSVFIRSASMSRYYRRMKSAVGETVKRTLGKKSKGRVVGRSKLYKHLIDPKEQNFPSYVERANSEFSGNDGRIRRQVRNGIRILKVAIKNKTIQRTVYLEKRAAKRRP